MVGKPTSAVGIAARSAGKAVGGRIGRLLGREALGAGIGGGAAQMLAKLFGHGDYGVEPQNSLIKGQSVATFQNGGRGMRITHREFIANVSATSAFTLQRYPINAALAETFPFLSQVARLFEQYSFEGLVFQYVPTSGMVTSTSPALGAVIMATDYDSYAPDFTSKQQMESYEFAISCVPYESAAHGVECAKRERTTNVLYTREAAPKGSLLDYDFGAFQIATVGAPSTYVCGELWVSYDVRLLKPRLPKQLVQRSLITSNAPVEYANWLTLTSGGNLNAHVSHNTTGFPVPFFNLSRPYSEWAGEPFAYLPGGLGRFYVLRKGRCTVYTEFVCQDANKLLGQSLYTDFAADQVWRENKTPTPLTGSTNVVAIENGWSGEPRIAYCHSEPAPLVGPMVSGGNGASSFFECNCSRDWDGADVNGWAVVRPQGWMRVFNADTTTQAGTLSMVLNNLRINITEGML